MKQQLQDAVIAKSKSKILEEAVLEWSITGNYDCEDGETCVCGKEHIKSYSVIFNMNTREVLTPIGSDCINHFDNQKLKDDKKIYERKNIVFNNPGKNHHGQTYDWICKNHRKYVEFLRSTRIVKERYKKLIKYFETVYLAKEEPQQKMLEKNKSIINPVDAYFQVSLFTSRFDKAQLVEQKNCEQCGIKGAGAGAGAGSGRIKHITGLARFHDEIARSNCSVEIMTKDYLTKTKFQ